MRKFEAFLVENVRRRLKEAAERLDEVDRSVASLVDDFSKPVDETEDIETTASRMADELPVYLLSRSLAEEGLALIEQIRWEAKILDIEVQRSSSVDASNLADAATKLKSWAASQEEKFEQFRDQSNRLIQIIMKFAEGGEEIGKLLDRLQKK